MRDITIEKRAEEMLKLSNSELERLVSERTQALSEEMSHRESVQAALAQAQKLEALGRLSGGIAHDFNNLLQVIIGNLNLYSIQNPRVAADPTLHDALMAAKTAAGLTDRLIGVASQRAIKPEMADLNQIVRSMSGILRLSAGKHIDVVLDLVSDLWKTRIDPREIANALVNLVLNARDAVGPRGTITIVTRNVAARDPAQAGYEDLPEGDFVQLAVLDNGAGMPPEVARLAFDAFFTTKDSGRGLGLGLSTIHGFVRQSGGHVRLRSEPGAGTTIELLLPAAKEESPGECAVVPAPSRKFPGGGRPVVLVVGDEHDVRRLTCETIEALGYTAVEAEDGPTALAGLRMGSPVDLVFSDVRMPGALSGFDLRRHIKEIRPEVGVLLTSGHVLEAAEDLADGKSEEIALLRKPYQPHELDRALRACLQRSSFLHAAAAERQDDALAEAL